MTLDRRQFLRRTGALGAAGAGGLIAPGVAAARGTGSAHPSLQSDGPLQFNPAGSDASARLPAVPFHGAHQAGILQLPPPAACFVAFDATAVHRRELSEMLRTLTDRARFLTTGGTPRSLGTGAPPSDSGTLGAEVPADGLTITAGIGAALFDDRYGLAEHRPRHLTPMRSFPNDDLEPARTGGDLLLQICAGAPDVAIHALRDIAKHTRGALQIRWRLDGFVAPPRPAGVPRNHFGFKDGIANPDIADPAIARRLLWVHDGIGEPAWASGGTYHVCRIIQMLIEFWDRVSLTEQQTMIGRYRDTGAPLGQRAEDDAPDLARRAIPATAHIRLANPRDRRTADSRIYRRGYNYDRGVDLNGNLDMGLIFNSFQQNIVRQFEATQKRLIGEPMVDYVTPVGGGYFFTLPGVRDRRDWLGRGLIAAADRRH